MKDNQFPRAPKVRLFRWWLIRNGFSESEADAVIEEMRKELSAIPSGDAQSRQFIFKRIARYMAHKRLGNNALAKDLQEHTDRYDQIISTIFFGIVTDIIYDVSKSLIESVSDEVSGSLKQLGSGTVTPSASAQLPPRAKSALESSAPPFVWPIEGHKVRMQFVGSGIIFDANDQGAEIAAAGSGFVEEIRHYHPPSEMPSFSILIRHPNNFQTYYGSWGHTLVEKNIFVKRGNIIAKISSSLMLFGMYTNRQRTDPRLYLPRFIGISGQDSNMVESPIEFELLHRFITFIGRTIHQNMGRKPAAKKRSHPGP
ncbi:MAG TPA: M23 family metallopeptidase [Stellaceae bacterium]|nr:M23 family metallopeptidase [Stellaceae bacterium]